MGMEALNNAARAAGFAMAGSEEIFEESKVSKSQPASTSVALVPVAQTRPQGIADWLKSYLSFSGRRAPVTPA